MLLAYAKIDWHFSQWLSSECVGCDKAYVSIGGETIAFSLAYDYVISLYISCKRKRYFKFHSIYTLSIIACNDWHARQSACVACVRSEQSVVHNFTHHTGNNALTNSLETGILDLIIEQCIVKKDGKGMTSSQNCKFQPIENDQFSIDFHFYKSNARTTRIIRR